METKIVKLTNELFEDFYGIRSPVPIRGRALMVDGEPKAVGGVALYGAAWLAFSDIAPDIRHLKKSIYATALEVRQVFEECKLPVIADRDEDEQTSQQFLTRLGFREDTDFWRYEWVR